VCDCNVIGHSVRPAVDKDGVKVLRVAFFCDINPAELFAAQFGADKAALLTPAGFLDLRVAVETPLSLNLLKVSIPPYCSYRMLVTLWCVK
jgi:hypothetical protein